MAKNIVLCCDGTSNEFSGDKTNVVKLYQVLAQTPEQLTYYHPGVGTMEAVGAVTSFGRRLTRFLGFAIGYGLEDDIKDAYLFLMRHYEPGDRIFLFGFSRGAYTVRALASLLHMYGLISRGNESLVRYAVRMLFAAGKRRKKDKDNELSPATAGTAPENAFREAADFKKTFSQRCPIAFVGVWDTVSSIGWFFNPHTLPHTQSNPSIEIGRHAIAIDERRSFFQQNVWRAGGRSPGPKDLRQVWFRGAHSDVGGGYPESESQLSNAALLWMMLEAKRKGLLIDLEKLAHYRRRFTPDHTAATHNSLTGKWWIAEFVPKRRLRERAGAWQEYWAPNLFAPRRLPPDAIVYGKDEKPPVDYFAALGLEPRPSRTSEAA